MKKISVLLAIVLTVCLFAACAATEEPPKIDHGAANVKQVARIVELIREIYPDTPAFYTADWNMVPQSAGHAKMVEMGCEPVEGFLPDADMCGTCVGEGRTSTIDFCFVDKRFWKGVAYKVVRDHEYSNTASDHYPLYVEIERI